MATKERKHKSISRIDSKKKKTHGWYVRVQFNNTMYSKFFSDGQYSGRSEALAAAIEYRNEVEAAIGKPRTERTVVGVHPQNQTGVVGVHRRRKHNGGKGRTSNGTASYSDVYEVTWSPEPNVVSRTSVSISKYGKKEALRRAVAIRKEKEREYYGGEIRTRRTS
jgi:hypothetical protein